ncbi:phosphate ABC transporter substrate-binding protein PstS [Cupriavidus sp. BIS7]|uniref:phosphate ABC transporter substrate-binding protein PstS n=1 Tax=Cupriavidus sp. BIS7 TaxID=1217718 RepID=UPI0003159380|nr:phosphate ABC transporter substrate-binding protein PstS [Cupriavidus sp. BIS7]
MLKYTALAILGTALISTAAQSVEIQGAGSTAAAPVYQVWSTGYAAATGTRLTYAAVGSGEGIRRIRDSKVDFGASDVPLSPQEASKTGLICIPAVVTAAVPVVNLPSIPKGQLRLTGDLLARIFLGKVDAWDAPEIRALNPGLTLPNLKITPVVRTDGSGTTYHFSAYLSEVNAEWKSANGAKSSFTWPASFTGAKGSGEVVKSVQSIRGAIGYVDYNYVLDAGLNPAQLRNADGNFVSATVAGFRDAVVHSNWNRKGDFTATLVNQPGAEAWPITMGTFIVVPAVSHAGERTLEAMKFVTWGYLHGDQLAREAKFVPLPAQVQANAYRELSRVTDASGKAIGLQSMAMTTGKAQ